MPTANLSDGFLMTETDKFLLSSEVAPKKLQSKDYINEYLNWEKKWLIISTRLRAIKKVYNSSQEMVIKITSLIY